MTVETRAAYKDRLTLEIDVIQKMGFSGYFLIVADFITWAKKQKIPVGPGRGSGAGSLAAFCLSMALLAPQVAPMTALMLATLASVGTTLALVLRSRWSK